MQDNNYKIQYTELSGNNEYRYKICKPFELLIDIEHFRQEKSNETMLYMQLSDLLFYMTSNVDRYPRMSAFLWTLESRSIKGQPYGVVPENDLEEQTKLVNMFLNLLYWDVA